VPNSEGGRVWSLAQANLNVKVKGQGHQGQKNAPSTPGSIQMVCTRCKQRAAAADGTIPSLPEGDFGACMRFMFGKTSFFSSSLSYV